MDWPNFIRCWVIAATVGIGAYFGGCDRTVVEDTKVKQGPNGTTVEKKTITEHPDGTVTEEKETHTSETKK